MNYQWAFWHLCLTVLHYSWKQWSHHLSNLQRKLNNGALLRLCIILSGQINNDEYKNGWLTKVHTSVWRCCNCHTSATFSFYYARIKKNMYKSTTDNIIMAIILKCIVSSSRTTEISEHPTVILLQQPMCDTIIILCQCRIDYYYSTYACNS